MNVFTRDSWLARFFFLVGDIVTLHILWIITSIPIITIGASTTALYYCCMKRIRRDEGYSWRNYLHSFKENFRQSTILWLLMLAVGFVLVLDFRIGLAAYGIAGKIMVFTSVLLMLPYLLVSLYIFPVQAKFHNPIALNLKNALLMSIANFGWTVLLVILQVFFVILTLTAAPFIGLLLVCGAGMIGYLNSTFFVTIFRKYLPEEFEEDLEATGMDQVDF